MEIAIDIAGALLGALLWFLRLVGSFIAAAWDEHPGFGVLAFFGVLLVAKLFARMFSAREVEEGRHV